MIQLIKLLLFSFWPKIFQLRFWPHANWSKKSVRKTFHGPRQKHYQDHVLFVFFWISIFSSFYPWIAHTSIYYNQKLTTIHPSLKRAKSNRISVFDTRYFSYSILFLQNFYTVLDFKKQKTWMVFDKIGYPVKPKSCFPFRLDRM